MNNCQADKSEEEDSGELCSDNLGFGNSSTKFIPAVVIYIKCIVSDLVHKAIMEGKDNEKKLDGKLEGNVDAVDKNLPNDALKEENQPKIFSNRLVALWVSKNILNQIKGSIHYTETIDQESLQSIKAKHFKNLRILFRWLLLLRKLYVKKKRIVRKWKDFISKTIRNVYVKHLKLLSQLKNLRDKFKRKAFFKNKIILSQWRYFGINLFKKYDYKEKRVLFRWWIIVNYLNRKVVVYLSNLPRILILYKDEKDYSQYLDSVRAEFEQSKNELQSIRNSIEPLIDSNLAAEYCREHLKSTNAINNFTEIFENILIKVETRLSSAFEIKQKIDSGLNGISQKEKNDLSSLTHEIKDLDEKIFKANTETSKLKWHHDQQLHNSEKLKNSLLDLHNKKILLFKDINQLDNSIKVKSEERERYEKEVPSLEEKIKLKKDEIFKKEEIDKKRADEDQFRKSALKYNEERSQKYFEAIKTWQTIEDKEKVVQRPLPENLVIKEAKRYGNADKLNENRLLNEISSIKAENSKLSYELTSLQRQNSSLENITGEVVEKIPESQIYLTICCGILLAILLRLYIFNT